MTREEVIKRLCDLVDREAALHAEQNANLDSDDMLAVALAAAMLVAAQ